MLPDYFEHETHRKLATAISNYYKKNRLPLTSTDELYNVSVELYPRDEDEINRVLDEMEEIGNVTVAKKQFTEWLTKQATKNAVLDSIDDVQSGNIDAVIKRLRKALTITESNSDISLDFKRDIDEWVYEAMNEEHIQTGWMHLDTYLNGGPKRGEIGIILGASNRGKSMALTNIAYGAAMIGSGKNVLIFSHEMGKVPYAKRLGARMSFRFPGEESPDEYATDIRRLAKVLMPGNVKIVKFRGEATAGMLEQHVEWLKYEEGFEPDVIIDDYLDLLRPERTRSEKRFELSDIYKWFRDWCDEVNCVGWTASQATRGSYDKEIITEKDIAEDIGKISIADLVIAICQTRQEAKEERARLYVPKIRDGAMRGVMFDVKYFPKQQAMISSGFTQTKDEKDV